jgi:hypothetical protein
MTRGADRVIYKPDTKSTEVFFVYITNAAAVSRAPFHRIRAVQY